MAGAARHAGVDGAGVGGGAGVAGHTLGAARLVGVEAARASHLVQEPAPSEAEQWPSVHVWQVVEPASAKEPFVQIWQLPWLHWSPLLEAKPAAHLVHWKPPESE